MAQYYTLEEAAGVLQTSPDEVRRMADNKKLRTFRDKGTLRFRAEEIHELARQMGLGSDADLQLGEVPAPKKGASPHPGTRSSKRISKVEKPKEPEKQSDVFEFNLSLDQEEEQVQLGALPPPSVTGSKSSKRSKIGPASPAPKAQSKPPSPSPVPKAKSSPPTSKSKLGPSTPAPKPASDSDVRLVGDGGDFDFTIPLEGDAPAPTPAPPSPPPRPGTASQRRSKISKLTSPDSGVRIVPLEPSDSDVKMYMDLGDDAGATGGHRPSSTADSDIRFEQLPREGKRDDNPEMVTEEIDLDAEMSKLGSATPAPKPRPSAPHLPTSSPFELSEEDLDIEEDELGASKSARPRSPHDSSDDFELTPAGEDLSPLELGSDEMPALNMDDSDEVSLGELSHSGGGSGINLRDPADSGISLEQEGSDELDFDGLDAAGTPAPSENVEDSDSEFELSLDDDSSETESAHESSEFELSLDDSGSSDLELDLEPVGSDVEQDSDSEFELTLDDSGGSSPLEEEDKDIFETDFEVPALEEESGSEAVALDEDTDVESSDFDLAIDEMDADAEEESGSQVVALEDDEEVIEDDDAPKKKKQKGKTKLLQADDDEDASEFAGIGPVLGDDDEDEEGEAEVVGAGGKGRVQYVEKAAPPWGPVPVILMLPCIIVLFVVGLMGFELVSGMMSYQRTGKFSGLLITPITEAITGEKMPGSKK